MSGLLVLLRNDSLWPAVGDQMHLVSWRSLQVLTCRPWQGWLVTLSPIIHSPFRMLCPQLLLHWEHVMPMVSPHSHRRRSWLTLTNLVLITVALEKQGVPCL